MKFNVGDRIKTSLLFLADFVEPGGLIGKNSIGDQTEYIVSYINEEEGYYFLVDDKGPGGQINFTDEDKFELA